MIDKNKYINSSQKDLNNDFLDACFHGNLEVVKYLLTSSDLKEHAEVNVIDDFGFRLACANKYTELIKYLIFEMNIQKTNIIDEYLQSSNNKEVASMFNMQTLNNELSSDKIIQKIVKV